MTSYPVAVARVVGSGCCLCLLALPGCAWQSYTVTRGVREFTGAPTRVHVIAPVSAALTLVSHHRGARTRQHAAWQGAGANRARPELRPRPAAAGTSVVSADRASRPGDDVRAVGRARSAWRPDAGGRRRDRRLESRVRLVAARGIGLRSHGRHGQDPTLGQEDGPHSGRSQRHGAG